jgi:hypothetical protein
MTVRPLPGFTHFTTHHCVTGSMRHIYAFNGHPLSEEMLLGIGNGVSFSYWHFRGQPPFMGGRGGFKPPMEELAGQRTGVKVEMHTTSSARKARQSLLEMLGAGQPVMLGCDMGFLPYFDFGGEEYHFGGHVIVACGYDPDTDQALVADRDEPLHAVSMNDLAKARGSTFKPFPPKHLWYTFDFSEMRQPTADEIRQAIVEQCQSMLTPPISNIGVKGIRKAAAAVPGWPAEMDENSLRFALFNAYIFISAVGGTGGGAFRYMLGRFLQEAAGITGDARLNDCAHDFQHIADDWEALAEWFRQTSEADDPAGRLDEAAGTLQALADAEEAAWTRVYDVARGAA